jgi:hypothetical protein
MRQIFWIIIIVVGVIFGAVWLTHRSKTRAVNSGNVVVREQSGDKGKDASAPAAGSTEEPVDGEPASAGTDAQVAAPAQGATQVPAQGQGDVVTQPTGDSISRNPPNGMVFAGTGKYQLYRQGDITWRLNTGTGQACILFATNAEWRLARVYQHGCGGS